MLLLGMKSQFFGCPARSPVNTLTEAFLALVKT